MSQKENEVNREKIITLTKNISLIIIIPVLILLSDDYNTLKNILMFLVGVLFLIEGFVLFSKQKVVSLINIIAGTFFIILLFFI